jgi:hypothetical protein
VLVVAALPALVVGWLAWRFAFDVPLLDEWGLVGNADRFVSRTWSPVELIASHNGHRIAVPRAILVPLLADNGWDPRAAVVLGWLVMVVAASALGRALWPEIRDRPLVWRLAFAGLASLLVFSTVQFENWQWAFMLSAWLGISAALGVGLLLRADDIGPRRLGAAVISGLVASFSNATGLLVWPLGLGLLLASPFAPSESLGPNPQRRRKRLALAAWLVVATVVCVVYARRWPGDANVPTPEWSAFLARPAAMIGFGLAFLGAPIAGFAVRWPSLDLLVWCRAAGVLGLVVAGLAIHAVVRSGRRSGRSTESDRLTVASFAIAFGAAALLALARSGLGPEGATASRLTSWSIPLWVGVVLVLTRVASGNGAGTGSGTGSGTATSGRLASARAARAGAVLTLAVVALGAGLTWVVSAPMFYARWEHHRPAARALLRGEPEPLLLLMHVATQPVLEGRERLARNRWSVFHEPGRLGGDPARMLTAAAAARLEPLSEPPRRFRVGVPQAIRLRVRNLSSSAWPSLGREAARNAAVTVTSRWKLDAADAADASDTAAAEGPATFFDHDVLPGESVEVEVCVRAPAAGRWRLELGVVQRSESGDVWFADRDRVASPDAEAAGDPAGDRRLEFSVEAVVSPWAWPLRAARLAWRDFTGRGCG